MVIEDKFSFIIPFSPESINDYVAFGKKYSDIHSLKRRWHEHALICLLDEMNNKRLPERFNNLIKLEFKMYFTVNRKRDEDNYYLMSKGITDAFEEAGMIKGDDANFVKFGGIEILIDKERPRVEVFITEYIDEDKCVSINYDGSNSDNQDYTEQESFCIARQFLNTEELD